MKNLLSLFDYSGTWSQPFFDDGWNTFLWDIKIDNERDIHKLDLVETCLDKFEYVDGILCAIPCTDFTVSGAQYWPKKDKDGTTKRSILLMNQVEKLIDLFTPTDPDYDDTWFWAIENPVGRIPTLFPHLGKPIYFNPCEFSGYLNLTDSDHNELDRIRMKDGEGVTREEIDFVLKCEAYTKKTGLWGYFNHDLKKKPVEPVRVCKQGSPIQVYGGKTDKTKEMRSMTPWGFSLAFYEANKDHPFEYETAHSKF